MKLVLFFLVFFSCHLSFAQVGINTTTPNETLDVNGTLRIQNTGSINSSKILGRDTNGTVGTIDVGDNITINNNTLYADGSNQYGIVNIPITANTPNTKIHNIDLDLGGTNAFKTVFRLTGANASFTITGIDGGTDGRHVLLLNITTSNMTLDHENVQSTASNRINTLGTPSEATSGQGAIELVYDGVLNRWLILNVRN
ncbi:MAG: hypothetical protein CMC14_14370 [Flavobacteriaceae bacterium]|nr:hypothetical protein [Flavobacteriaceae bacterium]|tara:strand:+ start:43695 stop:44291 length:597 start_codon:yes stop_codon:yes gene_type:complete